MFIGFHVKHPLFLPDFNETWVSRQDFEKYSNIIFQENPSGVSRVVSCGRTDRNGKKLMVAFRKFEKASKNQLINMVYVNNRYFF